MDLNPFLLGIIYKIVALIIGGILCLFGYKLSKKKPHGNTDVETQYKGFSLVMKNATPGSVLIIAGLLVIAITLFRGFSYEDDKTKVQFESHEEVGEH